MLLYFDGTEYDGATVGDVLADPDRFIGATLADPVEGLVYGRCKAKIMRWLDGALWINSFAHGRTTYELNHDAASVETALRNGEPAEAADTFVKLLLELDDAQCRVLKTNLGDCSVYMTTMMPDSPGKSADCIRFGRGGGFRAC